MERAFLAMGTGWWVRADHADDALLDRAEQLVAMLETQLSRFLANSALSRLNRDRRIEDDVLAGVVSEAEDARRRTSGAFDARTGSSVMAVGYDRSFEAIGSPATIRIDLRRPQVCIEGSEVRLDGEGALDLGGIAKGWAVDRVADLLSESGPCVVDGGGDIAVRGQPLGAEEWIVGVGDGLAVGLSDGAVATSSTLKRRWPVGNDFAHHIVDPSVGCSAHGVLQATVVAPTAATADAFATAIIANARLAVPALPAARAEALLQRSDGRWEMTPGMGRFLR